MNKYRIGFDVGGTKIRVVVLEDDKVVYVKEQITSKVADYVYEQIGFLYIDAINSINHAPHTIGVGIPGNINRPTYIFEGTNPQEELNKIFGREVVIENDANCFALAEAKLGAALGHNNVFGVILGTGVGGGIVINGELYRGTSGLVAEWGHNLLRTDGRQCWCGLRGCYEAHIGGPAIEKAYFNSSGENRRATDILTMNDVAPRMIQYDFYRDLATGLASIINVLDPEVVVIGGGLSKVSAIYNTVPGLVEELLFSKRLTARIVQSQLTDDAGAIGAALIGK